MSPVPLLFSRTLEISDAILLRLATEDGLDPRARDLWPVAMGRVMSRGESNELALIETVVAICKSPAELDAAVAWERESRAREDAKREARRGRPRTTSPAPPPGRWDLAHEG